MNKFIFKAEMEAWAQAARRVSSLTYPPGGHSLLLGIMRGPIYEYKN